VFGQGESRLAVAVTQESDRGRAEWGSGVEIPGPKLHHAQGVAQAFMDFERRGSMPGVNQLGGRSVGVTFLGGGGGGGVGGGGLGWWWGKGKPEGTKK